MDPTTRRITGFGLALAVIATVYAVNEDFFKAGVSLAGMAVCLLWGFWPDLRRRRSGLASDGTSADVAVVRAEIKPEATLPGKKQAKDVLELALAVSVRNNSDVAVTIRPTDLALVQKTSWRREVAVPAEFHPAIWFDPMGRLAAFDHFPEGQHTIPARSERVHYFYFQAVSPIGAKGFSRPGLKLRVTMCMPGPHPSTVPLSITHKA